MSGIGIPKVDARGRSGPRKRNNPMQIKGTWVARRFEMIESPAFRVLSLSAHRVLARVEIEHGRHGGADNGHLPVTFDDFQAYGIERHAIGPAIRECVALGFLVITKAGRAGNGDFRSPNVFRLTYVEMRGVAPTDNWEAIETDEEAKQAAQAARSLRRSLRARSRAAAPAVCTQDIESSGFSTLANIVHSSGFLPLKPRPFSGETRTGTGAKPALANQTGQQRT